VKVKFDSESMKLISLFEAVTHAKVKDCIMGEKLLFIIEENDMGRAIGKNGVNIKQLELKLRKKIKLCEYSSDVVQFVKNLIYPVEILGVKEENNLITINAKNSIARSMIIGREKQNLNHIKEVVGRYFEISDIKVAQ